ncbi:MAG: hypothetical protein DHS20C18_50170 [Saprospiraceae bacterium]|nr:MAG: hypothetical protein DHS20C18_50170 [Saprospiraceae bacterium]
MDSKKKLARIIQEIFLRLPEKPELIAASVKGVDLDNWVYQQKGEIVSHTGFTHLHLGAKISLLSAELGFLFEKMAHCAWGIGLLKGCTVFGKEDFNQILAIWGQCHPKKDKYYAVSSTFYDRIIFQEAFQEKPPEIPQLVYFNEIAHQQTKNNDLAARISAVNNDEQLRQKYLGKNKIRLKKKRPFVSATKSWLYSLAKRRLGPFLSLETPLNMHLIFGC